MATLNIPAGETSCNVSFTPNMDWTVSIPTDAETSEWFKLSDGVVETSSISGKASTEPVTIQVITTNQDVYDETPSCEVSLTMGGQTQVIAKVTRQTAAREFDIYLSGFLTDEGTQEAYDFSFEYSETPVAKYTESSAPEVAPEGAPELIWFTGKTGYMQVFKAESNFEWLASTPDWLTYTPRPQEGEYFVTADFAQITEQEINGAIGMIDFYGQQHRPRYGSGQQRPQPLLLRPARFDQGSPQRLGRSNRCLLVQCRRVCRRFQRYGQRRKVEQRKFVQHQRRGILYR